jgi:quercetin dioxygenase-like cupin family protein
VSGLRRGEAAGLRWCDIDFVGASLTVGRQLQETGPKLVVLPPKSIASNRVVALDPWTLQSWPRTATGSCLRGGEGYVFARPGGRAVQQAPGLWRTDLQRQDLSVPGREVVQSRVDIGPEAPLVKHTHPGEEIIYVLEGSLECQIEGQPPKTLNAGDTLTVPVGAIHAVRNVGNGNAAELATYVVEKGKPLLMWPSERLSRLQGHPLPAPPGRRVRNPEGRAA